MLLNQYLALLGVQQWSYREGAVDVVCWAITSHSKQGLLLMDVEGDVQADSDCGELITAILAAINFFWIVEEGQSISQLNPKDLSLDLLISMGKRSSVISDEFFPLTLRKVSLPAPQIILTSPLLKKSIWEKLR